MMSSSMSVSFTGGHVGWITNTSAPRTFSLICTYLAVREARHLRVRQRHAQVLPDLLGQRPVRVPRQELQFVGHRCLARGVVGAGGFEPPNTGSKVPRLATWPRPIVRVSSGLPGHPDRRASNRAHRPARPGAPGDARPDLPRVVERARDAEHGEPA